MNRHPLRRGLRLQAALTLIALSTPASAAAPTFDCTVIDIAGHGRHESIVRRAPWPSGRTRPLTTVPNVINAAAYAEHQDRVYALRGSSHQHVVTIDHTSGRITEQGPLRTPGLFPPGHPVGTLTAGAIHGDAWYLSDGIWLYTVNVDPSGSRYLRVRSKTILSPRLLPGPLADFAVTNDETLITATFTHRAGIALTTIDPATGAIRHRRDVALPPGTYGSVVAVDNGVLATANNIAGRSHTFHIDAEGGVTELATGPPATHTDAAGCLPESTPPPESPTPTPPETSPPTNPPSTGPPSTTSSPRPPHTTTSGPRPSPTPPSRPPPAPARTDRAQPPDKPTSSPNTPPTPETTSDESDITTGTKRQWVMTMLVIMLGAGVVVRRLR